MTDRSLEPVDLERVRKDAACIITRVGLGNYELQGPRDNIMVPESRVAWATVVHDLEGEGYVLVTPEEYPEVTGATPEEVRAGIYEQGTIFGVCYRDETVVALPQREPVLPDIEV